jgi:hypothetical protein
METTRRLLASLSPPKIISFVYITWRDVRQRLTPIYCRIRNAVVHPRLWGISVPTVSGIVTNIGYQIIILPLRVDRTLGNAKHRLGQVIRRFKRAMLLPIAHNDANHQLRTCQPRGGLLIPVRNIASLRKWNADNARCVCWIIRNITDPEAIESAIRLAGTIRWFDGDVDVDPPFEFHRFHLQGILRLSEKAIPWDERPGIFLREGNPPHQHGCKTSILGICFQISYPLPTRLCLLQHWGRQQGLVPRLILVLTLASRRGT